ncbi:unnamed protein product [Clonostachys rosea]|uniref:NR LBD domain-containing protein n=1 Tax=Bionectria ochroleuca TaxID=29856 RepID=A0ABY6UGX6_BIOOC|nr:unnamed protein product [Clonostachys rosea]
MSNPQSQAITKTTDLNALTKGDPNINTSILHKAQYLKLSEMSAKERRPLSDAEPHGLPSILLDPVLETPISVTGVSACQKPVSEPSLSTEPSSRSYQSDLKGLTETNHHTKGSEFYGPTGTFSFLSTVRCQANSESSPSNGQNDIGSASYIPSPKSSVVNLLHSSDYPVRHDRVRLSSQSVSPQNPFGGLPWSHGQRELTVKNKARDIEIERECVRLYFQNLHCIHPILEQAPFVKRCEREIWIPLLHEIDNAPSSKPAVNARFLALFNVVLALGAITAGETSMLLWENSIKFLDEAERQGNLEAEVATDMTKVYAPIRIARLFFERSKLHLEDIFESTSFETAQTLFLMVRSMPAFLKSDTFIHDKDTGNFLSERLEAS